MKTCDHCGEKLPENAAICENCGRAVAFRDRDEAQDAFQSFRVGFSGLIDSDDVRAALKKQKRVTVIAMLILVLLPFLIFLIYGAVSDKMDIGKAAVYGLIISAIFGLTTLIVTVKKKLTKPFEGVVIEKKKKAKAVDVSSNTGRTRTKYTVKVQTEDGRKIRKEVNIPTYEYLSEGDRVRYLPQFPQPFEKYDKGSEVLCMFCSRTVSVEEDSCPHCHNPLIK